ncbi:hypothetical protein [Kineococcus sp. SYSU DK005]|uniref:hypothetical protein n=1 Tax=Kineococcus sp. SYSU DK005 TaxID=3383126 RepID=UPI003D7CF8A7
MNAQPLRRNGWDHEDDQVRQSYWNGFADRADEEERCRQAREQQLLDTCGAPPADVLAEERGQLQRALAIRDFWEMTGLTDRRPPAPQVDPALRAAHITRCLASWGLAPQASDHGRRLSDWNTTWWEEAA